MQRRIKTYTRNSNPFLNATNHLAHSNKVHTINLIQSLLLFIQKIKVKISYNIIWQMHFKIIECGIFIFFWHKILPQIHNTYKIEKNLLMIATEAKERSKNTPKQ